MRAVYQLANECRELGDDATLWRAHLDDDGDKQIAARLGLKVMTVNQHTKLIYRHFGGQSRPELLARWLRRGWGSRAAWADGLSSAGAILRAAPAVA